MNTMPTLGLSVRQPWAWALMHGKHLENRTIHAVRHMHAVAKPLPKASPPRVVRLCIHASKGMTRAEYEHARKTIDAILGEGSCPRPDALLRGAIIGEVIYVDCIAQSTSPWFFGPHALVFERPIEYAEPVACGGELGFFEWRDNVRDAIEEPLPWMRKWTLPAPGAPVVQPRYIKAVAPAPLFDGLPKVEGR